MSQAAQVIALLTATSGAPIMNEAVADTANILPGMLVVETATGVAENTTAADATAPILFADTNPCNGGTIDDVYPVGDLVRFGAYHAGQEVNAVVSAGTAAIAKGAAVESDGAGGLQTRTTGRIIGYALEAVDNSGGAEPARLPIRVA